MYSLETLKSMQDEHTMKAKRQRLIPYIAKLDGDTDVFKMPFLGYYLPKGFAVTENKYFVDNSGFGQEGEFALTASQFLARVKQGLAYGIYEAGQFQVYIQEYKVL
jgi:hypothetical protein